MVGSGSEQRWAICPVGECEFAIEFDPDENLFCPSCEMELISECTSCGTAITSEVDKSCKGCGSYLGD